MKKVAGGLEALREARESATDLPRLPTFRQLLENPRIFDPPPAAVPHLVYRERSTLLSAREKDGKSTLASCAAAAVATGRDFLGGAVECAPVLYVALEEHVDDVVRRLARLGAAAPAVDGAPAEDIHLLTAFVGDDPVNELRQHADLLRPGLVIVDTLAALVATYSLESGDATGWQKAVQALTDLGRTSGAGVLLLHHQKKSTAEYRDSTAIGASVDVIATMVSGAKGLLATERAIRVKGRFGMADLVVNFEDGRYVLRDDGSDPDAVRTVPEIVLAFVAANPGASTNEITDGCGCRKSASRQALHDLVADGRLDARPGPKKSRVHYIPGSAGSTLHLDLDEEDA